jgi:hypothetical protein
MPAGFDPTGGMQVEGDYLIHLDEDSMIRRLQLASI